MTALAAADRRFRGEAWQSQPFFQAVRDQYLRTCGVLARCVSNMPTLTTVSGIARSSSGTVLDASAPSNFFLTNPEAIQRAVETKAKRQAWHAEPRPRHWAGHIAAMTDETAFRFGDNLAITPGQVVFLLAGGIIGT